MGMFQKVSDWLTTRGEQVAHGGNSGRAQSGAYYASPEAQQAYQGARSSGSASAEAQPSGDAARTAPVDRFSADSGDQYGGRVPYRSQRDLQADAEAQRDAQRRQAEEQQRRQQAAQPRQQQPFNRAPAQAQAAYPQQSNVVPFPGMVRGPEGNYYAHVEYVVLLRSRNECTKVIEYIKSNASVFLNMEFIANDGERQRCVDMLSGAAYTLGCFLNKISQRGIYLISSPSVYVVIDPAMQKYAAAPEAQGYVRPEYEAYPAAAGYGAATGARVSRGAYGAAQPAGYGAQGGYAAGQTSTYAAQPGGQPSTAYAAPRGGYGASAAQPGSQTSAYTAARASYAQPGAQTSSYAAQSGGYAAQPGAQTGAYATQRTASYPAGGAAPTSPTGSFTAATPPPAFPGQGKRSASPFGMQAAFAKSAEGGQSR